MTTPAATNKTAYQLVLEGMTDKDDQNDFVSKEEALAIQQDGERLPADGTNIDEIEAGTEYEDGEQPEAARPADRKRPNISEEMETEFKAGLMDDLWESVTKAIIKKAVTSGKDISVILDDGDDISIDNETADALSGASKSELSAASKSRKDFMAVLMKLGK